MPRHYYVAYGNLTLSQNPNPNLFVAIQIKALGQDEKDSRSHYAPSLNIHI